MVNATPVNARLTASQSDPAWTYVQSRAASIDGDHAQAAALLSRLFEALPKESEIGTRALSEAIGSGRFDLALDLAHRVPPASLAADARILVAANELKLGRFDSAADWFGPGQDGTDLSFLKPLSNAWALAGRKDINGALKAIADVPKNSPLAAMKNEQAAYLLLSTGHAAEAESFARRAIGSAGIRETRVREALASGFAAIGDKTRAAIMVDGIDPIAAARAQQVAAGAMPALAVDSAPKALSEVMTAISGDLIRLQRSSPPLGLSQVARFANPANASASIVTAVILDLRGRSDEALSILAAIDPNDPLAGQSIDTRVRILGDLKRDDEALALAKAAASAKGASALDFARLGDTLAAMKRQSEAADAYGRAIAMARAAGGADNLWSFYLLQASALEDMGRWPEAKTALQQGLLLAPDQPMLLNFLGYARLEHGEDVEQAEAMIRKASELAPDDGSIIDSLGWAQYKRGKFDEAIATLRRAIEKDPVQAEIQEHLGDALYKSGRRYEARFAWNEALLLSEGDDAQRLKAKLASGLTPATAAK